MTTQSKIVLFKTFNDPIQAHLVKGLLETNGIPCIIDNENIVNVNPLYSQAVGGVRLSVFEKDIPQASEVVMAKNEIEIDDNNDKNKSIACPHCGSDNISYGQPMKGRFGWVSIFIALALQVYPFSFRKKFHCFNCQADFKLHSKAFR